MLTSEVSTSSNGFQRWIWWSTITVISQEEKSVVTLMPLVSTSGFARQIRNWMVLDDEAISDHNFIYFELGVKGRNARRGMDRQIVFFNKMKFRSSIKASSKLLLAHSNISTEVFMNSLMEDALHMMVLNMFKSRTSGIWKLKTAEKKNSPILH